MIIEFADRNQALAPWLALWRTPGIGPSLFHKLLRALGTPEQVFTAGTSVLRRTGIPEQTIARLSTPDRQGVEQDLDWAAQPGHRLLIFSDAQYPARLREIEAPPPILFVKGDIRHLWSPQVAMVGSRNPSPAGRENAHAFAKALTQAGITVTSGLAMGIDGVCHRAALEAGGPTVAVAARGLDRTYPDRHSALSREIAERGTLLSEFPIGTPPAPAHFPRRNRIISGLSLGTLVVEAGLRSGSLITARHAIEQDREVFAIPGSIHNPMARGCHQLIRDGAVLTETVTDILKEIRVGLTSALDAPEANGAQDAGLDPDYRRLLDALGYDPTPINTLIERSGLTAQAVSSMLLILELNGQVALDARGHYSRLNAGA